MTLPTLPPHSAPPAPANAAPGPPELPQRPLLRRSALPPRRPVLSRAALSFSVVLHLVVALVALTTLTVGRSGGGRDRSAPSGGEDVQYVDITYFPGAGASGPLSAAGTGEPSAPQAGAAGAEPVAPAAPSAAPSPTPTAPSAAPRAVPPRPVPGGAVVPTPGAGAGAAGPGTPGAAPAPGAGTGGAAAPGAGGGGRGGLRPGFGDPRLIQAAPKEVAEPPKTQHERYMEHLEARIDAINDSLGIAAARERKATDWTVKDKNGQRWGISPDGIHLGPVKLPPVRFGGGEPIRGDATTEQGQRDQIKDQSGRAERDDGRAESIRRTRERVDKEREAARRDTTSKG